MPYSSTTQLPTKTLTRRLSDYIRLIFLTIAILLLISSLGLVLHAQNVRETQGQGQAQVQFAEKIKDLQEEEKVHEEKINSIDRRLLTIEIKQDYLLYIGGAITLGILAMLGERAKDIFFSPNKRRS